MFTAADFDPATFVPLEPLRTHRSCGGRGYRYGGAHCFGCGGTGQVRSPADQRRAAEREQRRNALRVELRRRSEVNGRNSQLADDVADGYGLLELNAPERLPALYASLANGRFDDVMTALVQYLHDHRTRS